MCTHYFDLYASILEKLQSSEEIIHAYLQLSQDYTYKYSNHIILCKIKYMGEKKFF